MLKLEVMSDVTADPLSSPAPARTPGQSAPRLTGRQRAIMALLLGTQFMLAIDFSILNVALPSIGAGLHIGNGQLQWVATAFALPAAGVTPVATPVFATIATAGSSGTAWDVRSAAATLHGLRLALAVDGVATLVIAVAIALALLPRAPRAAAGNRAAA
jgi:MFS family permease